MTEESTPEKPIHPDLKYMFESIVARERQIKAAELVLGSEEVEDLLGEVQDEEYESRNPVGDLFEREDGSLDWNEHQLQKLMHSFKQDPSRLPESWQQLGDHHKIKADEMEALLRAQTTADDYDFDPEQEVDVPGVPEINIEYTIIEYTGDSTDSTAMNRRGIMGLALAGVATLGGGILGAVFSGYADQQRDGAAGNSTSSRTETPSPTAEQTPDPEEVPLNEDLSYEELCGFLSGGQRDLLRSELEEEGLKPDELRYRITPDGKYHDITAYDGDELVVQLNDEFINEEGDSQC